MVDTTTKQWESNHERASESSSQRCGLGGTAPPPGSPGCGRQGDTTTTQGAWGGGAKGGRTGRACTALRSLRSHALSSCCSSGLRRNKV